VLGQCSDAGRVGPDERKAGGLMLTERNMHTYVHDLEQHLQSALFAALTFGSEVRKASDKPSDNGPG
jgi:hypothetical protein